MNKVVIFLFGCGVGLAAGYYLGQRVPDDDIVDDGGVIEVSEDQLEKLIATYQGDADSHTQELVPLDEISHEHSPLLSDDEDDEDDDEDDEDDEDDIDDFIDNMYYDDEDEEYDDE